MCLTALVILSSCATRKDFIYLQDMNELQEYPVVQKYEAVIHRDDKLSIIVNSKNPELALPFNIPGSNGNFSMTHSSPTITDNYPTITGNAAHKGNGGGVFVSSENGKSVKVDLLQGIITNNTANNYGGGICVDMGDTENSATVTVGTDGQGVTESDANPKISDNMAIMSGGGLYVRGTNANVTINSGLIAKNEVSAYVKNEDVANEMGGVTLNAGLVTHVVVTFDGNGGKVDETDTYTQNIVTNTNSKLAPNRFIRAGYRFAGWNTRADGLGDSYSEGDAKPHSSDITLYAQWVAQ